MISKKENKDDDTMVNDEVVSERTCSRGEGLGNGKVIFDIAVLKGTSTGDIKGKKVTMEVLGANGVVDVDNANIVLGGCTNNRGHRPACP